MVKALLDYEEDLQVASKTDLPRGSSLVDDVDNMGLTALHLAVPFEDIHLQKTMASDIQFFSVKLHLEYTLTVSCKTNICNFTPVLQNHSS